jgi:two-component system, NtrC family, response regulator HydG
MKPKGTVLIVDDRPEMATTLSDILEDYGYAVVTAVDGYQALKRVKESPIDIAFIDIVMPGINGVETFKGIKKISPQTDVIMITGFAVEELVKKAMEEGAYTVIYKPFDIKNIISVIEKCLAHLLILMVDDKQADREIIQDIMRDKGYSIATAASGYEAIEKAKNEKYDIIFLDVVMPGLDGEETFLEIKKIDPKASIIMLTGHSVDEVINRCLNQGAYACFYKPYEPEKLINAVEKIIASKKGNHQS